jgi:hypothetical protein
MLLELLSLGSSPAALPVASSQESAASVQPPSLKSSLLDVQPPFAIHKGSSLTQDVLGGQPHKSPTSNADPFANLNSLPMPVASGGTHVTQLFAIILLFAKESYTFVSGFIQRCSLELPSIFPC